MEAPKVRHLERGESVATDWGSLCSCLCLLDANSSLGHDGDATSIHVRNLPAFWVRSPRDHLSREEVVQMPTL
jgi:hypothetical protein